MTDNEIIKDLERYISEITELGGGSFSGAIFAKEILDLINRLKEENERLNGNLKFVRGTVERQKAEIERLERHELREAMTFNGETIKRAKTEAYKEFAERVKALLPYDGMSPEGRFKFGRIKSLDIDNLLKEMW